MLRHFKSHKLFLCTHRFLPKREVSFPFPFLLYIYTDIPSFEKMFSTLNKFLFLFIQFSGNDEALRLQIHCLPFAFHKIQFFPGMSTSFLFFIIYVGAYVILLALFSIIFVLCLFFLCWVIIIEFQLCFILTLLCFSSKLFLHHNFMFLISLLHSCIYVYKTCIFNTQQHICQMIILCVSEHWIYIYIIIHCLVNS